MIDFKILEISSDALLSSINEIDSEYKLSVTIWELWMVSKGSEEL